MLPRMRRIHVGVVRMLLWRCVCRMRWWWECSFTRVSSRVRRDHVVVAERWRSSLMSFIMIRRIRKRHVRMNKWWMLWGVGIRAVIMRRIMRMKVVARWRRRWHVVSLMMLIKVGRHIIWRSIVRRPVWRSMIFWWPDKWWMPSWVVSWGSRRIVWQGHL
jgi:hypothetical protein